MPPFPFFVGCDRSGTTLIQAVFDAHSALAIPYESHFIPQLLRRRGRYEDREGFDLDGFLVDLLAYPFAERWGISEDRIRARLVERPTATVPDAVREVFALYAESQGKSAYGDKTPGYVRRLPLLAGAFPEGRFVHIIRDGRDVALSLLEVEWGPNSIVDAARFWKQRVEVGRGAGRALGADRYAELRYEDFVEDPATETKRICEFLGLTFEASMLDYQGRAETIIGQSGVPHRHTGLRAELQKGKRNWRTQMKPRDAALFEAVAGTALAENGYERSATKIAASVRAQATAQLGLRKVRGIPDRIRSELRPRMRRLSNLR